jgi:hypothetical protein
MADYQSVNLDLAAPPNTYRPLCGVVAGFLAGTPVCQSTTTESTVLLAKANSVNTTYVVGLAGSTGVDGERVNVQYGGILTLGTTEDWDAIAGTSGGLTPGAPYYLSATTAGLLTATPPGSGGEFVAPVGVALSPVSLLIQISFPTAA